MVAATAKAPDNRDAEIRVYSYYRDAELRGSNLLYRLMRVLKDGESQILLAEHLSDETRHAWLWTELIRDLGAEPVPVDDGYQVRLGKRAGIPRHPVELLALTVVVEQRALKRYHEHLEWEGVPERTLEVLRAVSKDEGWHIDWIRTQARELAAAEGEPERFEEAVARYRAIDREVWAELLELERGWSAA